MHKISVPKQVSYSTFPLELIHSDAWGLAPIVSELGHKFYVIFVDNFTHFTWMFLLRHKSDVFNVFVHFKSLVKNQFNSTIKILRSDRGGEYDNHKFKSFCLDHGIQHQFSCPYTPQQNGVAERKHRHVVESGRAMLHQSQLPLSFWSYAFSTAIFLINRILSSVLNFVSPWEKFFHKKPPLQALKAFGCACYPLLRSYPSHKLQPKSSQCIFLGYLPMLKGYICLDTTSGRIYISSQAIFHESVFPSYTSVSSNSDSSTSSLVTPSSDLWLASLLSLPVESSSLPVDSTSLSSVSANPAPDVPSLPSLILTEHPSLDSTSIPSSSLPSSYNSIVRVKYTYCQYASYGDQIQKWYI